MTPADRTCIIVDANVLAVAEGMHGGASDECLAACIKLAHKIEGGIVVGVDRSDLILREYLRALKPSRRSGIGAKLATSLWRRRYSADVCRQVEIIPISEPPGSFEEVPEPLRDFDNDDQMYFAVAFADDSGLQIYQALDGEWWDRREELSMHGLDIQFLCATDLLDGS